MKSRLLQILAVLALAVSASAVDVTPPTFVPASGLQLSLHTGGYKFFTGDATTSPSVTATRVAKLGGLLPTREGFAASALLANTSRTAIPFEFNDAGAAAVKFKFSVSDANGTLVWQSDTDLVSAQVITPATLDKGERWKRTVQIPLKVDGAWLKPGVYTLEATLPATPSVSAATIFEVANLPEVPPPDTGILGHVLAAQATGDPLPVKAHVSITEVRLPNARYDHPAFQWSGDTDATGNFKVATPPGNFQVVASPSLQVGTGGNPTAASPNLTTNLVVVGVPPTATANVSVDAGKFSEVTLTLPAATVPPPPNSGISGLVLIGPASPVATVGTPNEKPLAGALVSITEIRQIGVFYIRPAFSWTGTANGDGKFKTATPPGRYRVTASAPPTTPVAQANTLVTTHPVAPAVAEVTVADGQYAEV